MLALDRARNALLVGRAEELGCRELTARDVTYVNGRPPRDPQRVTAKIRYKTQEVTATLTPLPNDRADVLFDEPLRDITPGQSVVFYQVDVVLGGGIIDT